MNLSISSFRKSALKVPLYSDLKAQKKTFGRFLIKISIFFSIFILCDNLIGGFLRIGLERYFGLNVPAQILLIGHSQTVLGIDKIELEKKLNVPVAKYARQGADLSNRLEMIRQYLAVHPNSVKVIVYDVSAHTFTGKRLSANSHLLFYPFINNSVVSGYVKNQTSSPKEYWLRKLLKLPRFSEVTLSLSIRGWSNNWMNLKYGQVDITRLKIKINEDDFRKISFDDESVSLFEETLQLVRSHNIHMIITFLPKVSLLNEVESKKFQTAIDMFEDYASKYHNITFLNYNPYFSDQYDLFYDPIHLNAKGQKIITEKLSSEIKPIIVAVKR